MKEVFALYGRVYYANAVYDWDDNYFEECPVLEVFDCFEKAYERFEIYVKAAYKFFADYCPIGLDTDEVEKSKGADLFADYNMEKDEYPEGDVQWKFEKMPGESAAWQMYGVNLEFDVPILAGLYIKKCSINPEVYNYD